MSLAFCEESSQYEIDCVINQLAGNNSSLAACALVSKRWNARCQQHYFRKAKLTDLRSSGWSPNTNDMLPEHDTSNQGTQHGELWVTSSLPQHLDHFKSLNGITSLTLDHIPITLFDFPALQHTFRDIIPTVRTLRLLCPNACPRSLLQFITTFKNLKAATIHAPSWVKSDQCAPHTHAGQLQGTLCLSGLDDDSNPFLSLLKLHATGIGTIIISKCRFHDPSLLQRLLSSARRSIRNIQIFLDTNDEFPDLSLQDFSALEQVSLNVAASTAPFHRVSTLISTATSLHFKSFILKLRATAQRERDVFQVELVDRLSCLDTPLSSLARLSLKENRKFSLVLLGRDPEFLAQGLTEFHEVGYIWAGEDTGEDGYFWTFTSPKNSRVKRSPISILHRLFKRKT